MKNKTKTIAEKKADVKAHIISNSKNAKWAGELLGELISLQKQEDVELVELIVPCKEVKETLDLGAVKIMRTIRGFLFQCKGGMSTFVESRMTAVAAMLHTLFELHGRERDEEEEQLYQSFNNALSVIFQAPIFASLGDKHLFGIAADILRCFNEFNEENKEVPHEETEEDIKANNEAELANKAAEVMADLPLPPEI